MKKTFSRALSLLLVLVMVMGVMPVALAAGSVSVTGDATLTVGDTGVYTASVVSPGEGWTANYSWTGATGSGATATLTPDVAGNVPVSCEVTFTKDGEENQIVSDGMTVVVSEPAVPATGLTLSIDKSIIYGGSDPATLTVTATPAGAEVPSDVTYIYDSSVITITNGVVKGKSVGTSTIVAQADGLTSNAVSVEVKYTKVDLVGGQSAMTLIVGEEEEMGVYAYPTTSDASITYSSSNSTVASVDKTGVIIAKSEGTATITATMKLNSSSSYELGNATVSTIVTVKDGGYIDCDDVNTTSTYAVVAPALYYNGYAVSNATFTYAASNNLEVTTSDYKTFYVVLDSYSTGDSGYITFYANDFYAPYTTTLIDGSEVGSKTVNVSFFTGNTLSVVLSDNVTSFYFNQEGVVDSATIGSYNVPYIANYSLYDLIGQAIDATGTISKWKFTLSSTSGGYLTYGSSTTDLTVPLAQLGSVRFIQSSSTNKTTVFTVSALSSSGTVLGQLYVTITAGEGTSGIEYSTTASNPVTFSASDFYKYWNASVTSTSTYGTLSYVVFGTPSAGTLYTTSARTTKATTSMKFYYSTTSSGYSLSSVTYMPTSSTAQYTVEIPFAAYSSTGNSVAGTVVIKVNEQSSTIGARGVSLSSVADSIAESYYLSTSRSLGYVVFSLPSAQYATIYRSIPEVSGYSRVTEATRAQTGDCFYYSGTYYSSSSTYSSTYSNTYSSYLSGTTSTTYATSTNYYPLDSASLVPAAGYSGKLTLNYTAYTTSGSNPVSGYVTFTIQSQTASKVFSDVTASSYSWSADSVDFLYYEGVAQGSNGKYNPSANITRGDFMLMLYRAFLEEDYDTHSITSNFSDVTKGSDSYSQEIYQAVGVAKYLGIAQGTNGKYNPKANITREEAMVLIYRTLDEVNRSLRYSSSTSASSFTDYSSISSWATTAISSLVKNGVIQGSNNKISPKANITRAEMACILHRVITY